jgi:hypothetical protein
MDQVVKEEAMSEGCYGMCGREGSGPSETRGR